MAAFTIHSSEHGGLKHQSNYTFYLMVQITHILYVWNREIWPLKILSATTHTLHAFIVLSVGVRHGKPTEEDTLCVWVHTWGKKEFGLVNQKFPSSPTSQHRHKPAVVLLPEKRLTANLHCASCCPLYLFWILASLKVALVILDTCLCKY